MKLLPLLWRFVLLLAVFAGVGLWTSHAVIAHAVAKGTPEPSVRMAGAMAGLFAGGIAACFAGLCVLLARRRPSVADENRSSKLP